MPAETNGVAAEANRLYWQSDIAVAEIAQQLDLSRRALYQAVVPLPTGASCTRCGGVLAYANRTARAAQLASCAACGAEDTRSDVAADTAGVNEMAPTAAVGNAAREAAAPRGRTAAAPRPPRDHGDRADALLGERAVRLGAATLAGAVLGVAIGFLATRRG